MLLNVTQVARTYRSNALWHSREEAWRQRGRALNAMPMQATELTLAAPVPQPAGSSPFDRFAHETAQGLAAVLNAAVRVKKAVRKLSSVTQASALDQRTVHSSNAEVLTASVAPGAQIRTYTMQVDRIATAQMNEGKALPQQSDTIIAVGSNQMKVTAGDVSIPFSVYILRSDTNLQALQKIHTAINQASLPVRASLITDDAEGTVKLLVAGATTGSGSEFTITDVYGSAARVSGIELVSQAGADGQYHIDHGETLVSGSNIILLDGGNVTLTLHQSSALPVELSILPDEVVAKQELQQVAHRYNELCTALGHGLRFLNRGTVSRALNEATELGLDLALHPRSEEEEEKTPELLPSTPWAVIGMSQYADGTMQVDDEALENLIASSFAEWQSSLRAQEGPVGKLVSGLNRLLSLPTEDLLDRRKAMYQAFASYQFRPWGSLRTYLPLPLAGMLVNRIF